MSSPYKPRTIPVTPILTVAATYVANDYVGTSGVAMVFANVTPDAGGGAWLQTLKVIDKSAATFIAGQFWLFDSAVTPPADSAAWSLTDADMAHFVAVLDISNSYGATLNCVGIYTGNPVWVQCAAGSKSLYGCWVTLGAPAYASLNLTFKPCFVPD